MLHDEEKRILAGLRLEQAHQCIKAANALLAIGDIRGAVNRAYYAVFHAMRSVLATEGKDFSKHSGVISYFRMHYVKNGVFGKDLSDTISNLFASRSMSDYDDYFELSEEDVLKLVDEANGFVAAVKYFHEKEAVDDGISSDR